MFRFIRQLLATQCDNNDTRFEHQRENLLTIVTVCSRYSIWSFKVVVGALEVALCFAAGRQLLILYLAMDCQLGWRICSPQNNPFDAWQLLREYVATVLCGIDILWLVKQVKRETSKLSTKKSHFHKRLQFFLQSKYHSNAKCRTDWVSATSSSSRPHVSTCADGS